MDLKKINAEPSLSVDFLLDSIIRGDCFEILPLFPRNFVDLIIADMPYNRTKCKWESLIDFQKLWELYHYVLKPEGIVCLFGSEPFTSRLILSNEAEFQYKWIWKKFKSPNFMQAKKRPLNNYEEIGVFYTTSTPIYNPIMKERSINGKNRVQTAQKYNSLDQPRKKSSITACKTNEKNKIVIKIKSLNEEEKYPELIIDNIHPVVSISYEKEDHPTQKPTELYEYFIKTYTKPQMLVLDNFSGSGTNAIACLNTNRHFICIEKDQDADKKAFGYIQMALNRIRQRNMSNSFKKTVNSLYTIYQLQAYFDKYIKKV